MLLLYGIMVEGSFGGDAFHGADYVSPGLTRTSSPGLTRTYSHPWNPGVFSPEVQLPKERVLAFSQVPENFEESDERQKTTN